MYFDLYFIWPTKLPLVQWEMLFHLHNVHLYMTTTWIHNQNLHRFVYALCWKDLSLIITTWSLLLCIILNEVSVLCDSVALHIYSLHDFAETKQYDSCRAMGYFPCVF